jgi:hypothetical protein
MLCSDWNLPGYQPANQMTIRYAYCFVPYVSNELVFGDPLLPYYDIFIIVDFTVSLWMQSCTHSEVPCKSFRGVLSLLLLS